MKQWFVASTKAREESRALFNLKQQGFNAYLPQYKKTRRHARKTDVVLAPLFPKYLFVEIDMNKQKWSAINSTIGVGKLLQFGSHPTPVPVDLIHEIRAREGSEGIILMDKCLKIKTGDAVNITSGAFIEHSGVFDCYHDDERVVILLNLMGRNIRVRLPSSAINA